MKRMLTLLALLSTATAFAQESVNIKIHVRGLEAETAYLGFYYSGKTLIQDSAEVVNGTFTFESDTLFPQGMYLVVLPPTMEYFDLFLDEDQTFRMQTDMEDLTGSLEVNGSQVNEIFTNDLRFLQEQQGIIVGLQEQIDSTMSEGEIAEIQERITASQEAIIEHRTEIMESHPDLLYSKFLRSIKGPDIPPTPEGEDEYWAYYWFKEHYFDELDLTDPALLRTPVTNSKLNDYLDKYTVQDPDSLIAAVDQVIRLSSGNEETYRYYLSTLFNKYLESKLLNAEPVMIHIAQRYYLTGQAPWADPEYLTDLEEHIRPKAGTLVGDPGKDFIIEDENDQPVRLHDIDAEWIVLYFWSYDCGTCKKVTPKLVEMIPSYLEDGVQLVSVCTNGDREIWKEKLAEYGIPGITLADPARTSGFDRAYNVDRTPIVYVLDKDFVIRYKQISIEDLGAVLDFELKKDEEAQP